MTQYTSFKVLSRCLILSLAICGCLGLAEEAMGETYGTKNAQGIFAPKVTVTVGKKEVLIKKLDPRQSFRSISIAVKNRNLQRNVGLLSVEWISADNVAGKPIPFAGPFYNPTTKVFQDSMSRSAALKIVEKTNRNLFEGKPLADLFAISVDDEPLISSESASEKDRTVQLGTGRDVSLSVDKTSIDFNENNLKKGEILDVDNRSGLDQVIGVALPDKNLLYFQKVVRKYEQGKIPREEWDRFSLGPGAGIFIVLIPEPDAASLEQLNGKEVLIKVYQGNRIRDTIRVPIRTASDVRSPGKTAIQTDTDEGRGAGRGESAALRKQESAQKTQAAARTETAASQPRSAREGDGGAGILLWGLQIANLGLLVSLGIYGIFFMLPKLQVLEDRLAKNEMFLHGTREAIREELDQIKEEIVKQCEEVCQEDDRPE